MSKTDFYFLIKYKNSRICKNKNVLFDWLIYNRPHPRNPSLRASSPIWASEASVARTRERGAEERRALLSSAPRGFAARSRVLPRLASLAQIGKLARRLSQSTLLCGKQLTTGTCKQIEEGIVLNIHSSSHKTIFRNSFMVKMSGTFEVEPRKNAKFKWTSLSEA